MDLSMSPDNPMLKMFPSYVATCDNRTIWLPFSPRVERIHSYLSLYYLFVGVEAVSLILTLICLGSLIVTFWRHKIVHVNLTLIFALNGAFCVISGIFRLVQIGYEIGWIPIRSQGCFPVPQIVIFRLSQCLTIVLMMGAIAVERAFATYFVIDYEKRQRRWIAFIIALPIFAFSIFICSQVLQGTINGVFFSAAMLIPVLASIIAIRQLLRRNEKRLEMLNDTVKRRSSQDQYTLSIRLQLRENIWTMQKIYRMARIALPLFLIGLPLLFLPPIFLQDEENWWILELFIAGNNAVLGAGAPIITAMAAYVFEQVRRMFIPNRFLKERVQPLVDVPSVKDAETDQYFDQLHNLFEMHLERSQR